MRFNLDSPQFNPPPAPLTSGAKLTFAAEAVAADDMKPYMESLAQHGGVYRLLDDRFMQAVVKGMAQRAGKPMPPAPMMKQMQAQAEQFFKYLNPKNRPYTIDSALISHLTFPCDGRTFSKENDGNEQVPAFMTFVGQFIDHDLTLNPFDLFKLNPHPEDGPEPVLNAASALLDLDSVYNRSPTNALAHGTLDTVFDTNPTSEHYGRFRLVVPNGAGPNAYDLTRNTDHASLDFNKPFIFDLRNDENQLILQVHILLMRVHNRLIDQIPLKDRKQYEKVEDLIDFVRSEVVYNWQSFVLQDYLPTVVSPAALGWVAGEIMKPKYGNLRHKPEGNGSVRMPHEFAISFRMGHTQLRDGYQVQPGGDHIPLFNNRSVVPGTDLRGTIPLPTSHVINWSFFSNRKLLSNKIDSHVTSVVFDLPQSTVPDMVKQVGNLPQRNLIRSSQVQLTWAEELLSFYGIAEEERLSRNEVEPDPEKQMLFQLDEQGHYDANNDFRTPLWYYVIKEAELRTGGQQLGPLGGRIIAEVIAGGIYYQSNPALSVVKNPQWVSKITNSRKVLFEDLVHFVTTPFFV